MQEHEEGITHELDPAPALTGRAKLVVLDGADEGAEVPIDRRVVVGSGPGCDLVLDDRAVSRRHASFCPAPGGARVEDLESRNGTFVEGTRVGQADVALGAVVKVGATTLSVHPAWRLRELPPSRSHRFGELYGASVGMREAFAVLEQVAASDVTVLVEGETGTGKDLAARSLHAASSRRTRPFVVFDCAAVPRELAESELFGHARGAFTGAVADRAGAFERAAGGTLFLDEIGELPLDLQPKLLRALECGAVRRVGGDDVAFDVRVVAATNRDLHAEVRRGRFRADLLYRLDVVKVRLPPLRHRPDDVPGLTTHLLMGRLPSADEVGGENLRLLTGYGWPGNVRELRNVLDRAVALGRRPDGSYAPFADLVVNVGPPCAVPSTLGAAFPGVASPLPFKEAKEQLLVGFERAYVDALMARHGGNLSQAAAAAGLSRKHLYQLLRKIRGHA